MLRTGGTETNMKFRKVIDEPIAVDEDGVQIAGGLNAVIEANVGEADPTAHVSSKRKTRIVQRGGKTVVHEDARETRANEHEE